MHTYNIEKAKIVENESLNIDVLVNKILENEVKELDAYMDNLKRELNLSDLSISELNLVLMKLCSYSYYLSTRQELIGVRQDIAAIYEKEKYNKSFNDLQGTVASKTSRAEELSQEEAIISLVWEKAYKAIKLRIDSLNRYIDAVKKITSTKMAEMQLTQKAGI